MHATVHLMNSVHNLISRKMNNNEDLADTDICMLSNYLDTILEAIENHTN
ncbi:hypothetical protein [Anaerophilus nitritogenes]|nr:hypothetical protein [Anaerophilus nitritogenes]